MHFINIKENNCIFFHVSVQQLYSADASMSWKLMKIFFDLVNMKKKLSKVAYFSFCHSLLNISLAKLICFGLNTTHAELWFMKIYILHVGLRIASEKRMSHLK